MAAEKGARERPSWLPVGGLPKKRLKKTASCNTETSIVVASASGMVFPPNQLVASAEHQKRKRKRKSSSSPRSKKSKGSGTTASASIPLPQSSRSETGSNDPVPIQTVYLAPFGEQSAATVQTDPLAVVLAEPSPRKRIGLKKKLTPKKLPIVPPSSTSPASNTRSKKKLLM